MSAMREAIQQMRRDVHATNSRPALYTESPSSSPVLCNVRVHRANATHGGLQGTSAHYSEREEEDIKLRFDLSEVQTPKRGGTVVFSTTEGYTIDRREADDIGFVYCPAIEMTEAELTGLPVPSVP